MISKFVSPKFWLSIYHKNTQAWFQKDKEKQTSVHVFFLQEQALQRLLRRQTVKRVYFIKKRHLIKTWMKGKETNSRTHYEHFDA